MEKREVTSATLQKSLKILSESSHDVAAGLSEESLNDFLKAHWESEQGLDKNVYKGGGKLDDLKLSYDYDVTAPGNINLSPLATASFKTIYQKWIGSVPELARYVNDKVPIVKPAPVGNLADNPPPNVKIVVPAVTITIRTEGDKPIVVSLNLSMRVTGFVQLATAGSTAVVKIVPIDARIENVANLARQIDEKLRPFNLVYRDDQNCVELKRLILYIANIVLANRIGSFVSEFGFPVPIALFSDISLSAVSAQVVENLLVLLGNISAGKDIISRQEIVSKSNSRSIEELRERSKAVHDFATMASKVPSDSDKKKASLGKFSVNTQWPSKGIFLMMKQSFFQLLAQNLLVISDGHEFSGGWEIFKYSVGWDMSVRDPAAIVADAGLQVSAKFHGRAWAKACIGTHCGDLCHTISASADSAPSFNTVFYFDGTEGQELWMSAGAYFFTINWNCDGLPWPFNKFVGWFLSALTDAVVLIASTFNIRWKKKLTSLPETFPGTTLKYEPKLEKNVTLDFAAKALVAAGRIDFKGK